MPTPLPSPPPYVDPCKAKKDAWDAVKPVDFALGSYLMNYDSWDATPSFSASVIPTIRSVPNATLGQLIDYICCVTCRITTPWQVSLVDGWQADCSKRTFYQPVQDKCKKTQANLAFLHCWTIGAVNAGWTSSANFGLLALLLSSLF
jgi:hypothetical protein